VSQNQITATVKALVGVIWMLMLLCVGWMVRNQDAQSEKLYRISEDVAIIKSQVEDSITPFVAFERERINDLAIRVKMLETHADAIRR
jgi:hypothetical protein